MAVDNSIREIGGVSASANDEKKNACMTLANKWLMASKVIEKDINLLENTDKEAYYFLRNVFKNAQMPDKDILNEKNGIIREISNSSTNYSQAFSTALKNFSTSTNKLIKDYDLFKTCVAEIEAAGVKEPVADAGVGKINYPDGSYYEGETKDGEPNGFGCWVFKDGTVYDGEFKEGVRSGQGTIKWADGDWYKGGWNENGPDGYGEWYYSKYKRTDKGYYKDGYRSGKGRLEWENGGWYEGEWNENGPHGKGRWKYSNGVLNVGDFVDGCRKGYGVVTFTNGDRFEGSWSEDSEGRLCGTGTYIYKDGRRDEGSYLNGEWQDKIENSNNNNSFVGDFVENVVNDDNDDNYWTGKYLTDVREMSGLTYFRNILGIVLGVAASIYSIVYLQTYVGEWYMMLGAMILAAVSFFIYVGDGDGYDSIWNPASIFGYTLIMNGIMYFYGSTAGDDPWYYFIWAFLWCCMGLYYIKFGTGNLD